ncbi:MAG: GntR family transcriptional regulator, partial [Clostridiales Family XIII bacterium]|nr:GntR family transcriptional regulator [Clostridiales Family XIII bacterium]
MQNETPKLDRLSPKPLYQQLDEIFRFAIYSQQWQANHAIPSEQVLGCMYGVSRMTVRSVITQLVNEGLLRRVQGKGTFVTEKKISATSPAYMGVREQLERMGYKTRT